jgi:hypothetical protein
MKSKERYWVRMTRPDGSIEVFSFHSTSQGAIAAAEQCSRLAKRGFVFEAFRAFK